jgi:hypothetical protein
MLELEEEKSRIKRELKEESEISIKDELSNITVLERSPKTRKAILELLIKQIEVELVSSRYISLVIEWKVPEFGVEQIVIDREHSTSTTWKEEELSILRTMYPAHARLDILEKLPNRAWMSICRKASQLGIKRPTREENNDQNHLTWSDLEFLKDGKKIGEWKQTRCHQ